MSTASNEISFFTEEDVNMVITKNKVKKPSGFSNLLSGFTKKPEEKNITTYPPGINGIPAMIKDRMKNDPPPNYYHYRNNYDFIYSVSDIHADYRRLLRHLHKFEIVNLDTENPSFDAETLLGENDETIYEPKFITDVEWTAKENTLLVICGDIIDGRRIYQVDDNKGVFEILLHMFLRNLKFKAQKKNSDIMLICGNHDVVIYNSLTDYIHTDAKNYYNFDAVNRKNILQPFYHNFTLFFGITKTDAEPTNIKDFEILFLHGGIHYTKYNTTEMFFENTLNDQKELFKNEDDNSTLYYEKIQEKILGYEKKVDYDSGPFATWTRNDVDDITSVNDKSCDRYAELPTIIVGHCQSIFQMYKQPKNNNRLCTRRTSKYNNDPDSEYDNNPNCVYAKCFFDKNMIPKVVNIDTIMSSCFKNNSIRAFEMLKIYASDNTEPRFNKYTTISLNNGELVEYEFKEKPEFINAVLEDNMKIIINQKYGINIDEIMNTYFGDKPSFDIWQKFRNDENNDIIEKLHQNVKEHIELQPDDGKETAIKNVFTMIVDNETTLQNFIGKYIEKKTNRKKVGKTGNDETPGGSKKKRMNKNKTRQKKKKRNTKRKSKIRRNIRTYKKL